MKKIRLLKFYAISIITLFLGYSCTNDILEESTNITSSSEVEANNSMRTMSSPFYYYSGKKQFLHPKQGKEFILLNNAPNESQSYSGIDFIIEPKVAVVTSILPTEKATLPEERSWAIVSSSDALSHNDNVLYRGPVFLTEDKKEIALSHLFYVKLKKRSDVTKLKSLEEEYKVKLLGRNKFMELWFTFECSENSLGNSLEISRKIYESGEFSESYPDLINLQSDAFCVNDPKFSEQWHLSNNEYSLNLCAIRDITTGDKSVVVAVLDQGIELNHPDLNLDDISYDTETGTSPSHIYGEHGTNCAGFISAKTNNRIGIASLAPSCRLMSVSNTLISSLDSSQKRANGINFAWQNGACVISNSWGSGYPNSMLDDAISNALTKGRSGKGTVVVFATGNNSSGIISYPSSVAGSGLIAVGASDFSGKRANFSQYGNGLDIVAPGKSVLTTNINASYSSGSGTSYATPLVAATSALLISVNPNLTASEVEAIICKYATKLPAYSFVSKKTYGTWNVEVGYGLLNPVKSINAVKGNAPDCFVLFKDKTVTSDTFIEGCAIEAGNFILRSRANLVFRADDYVQLNAPMTIEYGSSLMITH